MKQYFYLFLFVLFTTYSVNAQKNFTQNSSVLEQAGLRTVEKKDQQAFNKRTGLKTAKTDNDFEKSYTARNSRHNGLQKAPGALINETFDTFLPTGWTAASDGYWMSAMQAFANAQGNPIAKEDGDAFYAAFDAFNGQLSTPFSLITPALAPTAANHVLTYEITEFLLHDEYLNTGIQLFVEVSADNEATWTTSTTNVLAQIQGHNTEAAHNVSVDMTLDLNSYVDQIVKVRFRAISDYGGFILGLDNVRGVPLNIPEVPELEVRDVITGLTSNYTPLHHVESLLPSATVKNNGVNMTGTATLNFAVTPGTYSQDATITALNNGASESFAVAAGNEFAPTTTGAYTVTASTDFSDPTPANNSATATFNVTDNIFAMDNGTYTGGVGSNNGTITFGNVYKFTQQDVVTSFMIAFGDISSYEFKVRIYSVNDQLVATQIYESPVFNKNTASAENTLTEFEIEPQILPAGKYFFAVNQFITTNIGVANDGAPNGAFYVFNSEAGVLNPNIGTSTGNLAIRVKTSQVAALTPENGTTDVEIDAPVTATFLQNMTAGTLTDITITPDPGAVSASIAANVLTIAHNDFTYNTNYTVKVPTTAVAGLISEATWSFTTKLDPTQCNTPTNLNASNILYYNATLSWQENGPATEWNIKYGPEGFDVDTEGTLVTGIDNNTAYVLSGLNDATTYDYYVQSANCPVDVQSDWGGPFTFSTQRDCTAGITSFPWNEGFEDTEFAPVCWQIFDQDGAGTTWARNTTDTYLRTGTGSAGHTYNSGDQEGWLVTPKISIPATGNFILKFWSYSRYPGDYGKNSVWISTGSDNPADGNYTEKWTTASVTATWVETTINLSADYAGEEIYIGFKYEGDNAHSWYIDDVSIVDFSGVVDAEVVEINTPVNGANLTATETVKVVVRNNGSDPMTGFSLKLEVNGTEVATETVTETVASLTNYEYTFAATADLSAIQPHSIRVTVNLTGDSDTSNDAFVATVTNYGNIAIMSDTHQNITECGIRFYDDGVNENYVAAIDDTQTITFLPDTQGQRINVEFSELNIVPWQTIMGIFEIPGDTLFVYEGTQQNSANLLAYYTGDYTGNLPEAVTSYSTDGALTFVFKKSSGFSESGWNANITCVEPVANDAGVTSIVSPLQGGSANAVVKANIKNFGGTAITSMDVAYKLNEGTPVVQTFTGNIAPGATTEFTFTQTIDLSDYGDYTLEVYTQLEGDIVSANNSQTINIAYRENVLLYGYRIYDDAQTFTPGIISFNSNSPSNVTTVSSYADGSNSITGGEFYDGTLYLFSRVSSSNTPVNFIKLNTQTWTAQTVTITRYALDMAFDYSTNTMYGLASGENTSDLYTINLETGVMTLVGTTGKTMMTLACSKTGELFGVDSEGNYCSVNKTNGTATVITSTGISPEYIQSMAFDHNTGRLFWAMSSSSNQGKLLEIDPATGAVTDYGTLGGNAEVVALFTPYELPVLSVESLTPADNSTDIEINTELSVTFNMSITPDDLSKVSITPDPGNVRATISDKKLIIAHDDLAYNTEYTVTVLDGAVVDYHQPIEWSFTTQPEFVFLNHTESPDITLYPNPAHTVIRLSGIPENSDIAIYDISGRLVKEYITTSPELDIDIDFESGTYFVKIGKEDNFVTRKLIVK